MARDRVRNVPVSSLADPIRDQFNSRVGSRRYVLSLVTRILLLEVKQSLQHFLEDVYQTAIEHVQEKLQPDAARRATLHGFQQFAASLGSRCVLHGPPLSEAEQGLPAAALADRTRRFIDLPRVRHLSGEEQVVHYPKDASLHDFYQIVRETLGLPMHHSLVLLRGGTGSSEASVLSCSRHVLASKWVKKAFFVALRSPEIA